MYLNSEIIKRLNVFLEEHKDVSFTSAQLYSDFFEPLITIPWYRYTLPCDTSSVTKTLNDSKNWQRLCMKTEKVKNRYYYQYEKRVTSITRYKKIKNRLYFENKESIPFYYDFST